MLRTEIKSVVTGYLEHFPEDTPIIKKLEWLIANEIDVTSRKEFDGHVTCGGVIISPEREILLIHHRALDKWLFPGGHIEKYDASMRAAALREITEEMGVDSEVLAGTNSWLDRIPIHIDCHSIPENVTKNEPTHEHFDFRYVFFGRPEDITLQPDEVIDWAWAAADRVQAPVFERLRALRLV